MPLKSAFRIQWCPRTGLCASLILFLLWTGCSGSASSQRLHRTKAARTAGRTGRARRPVRREPPSPQPRPARKRGQGKQEATSYRCRPTAQKAWLTSENTTRANIEKWFPKRLTKAKAHRPELLQIQLVRRGVGWGCDYPWYYVGTSPGETDAGPCIAPLGEDLLPGPEREGWTRFVEGYFTGQVTAWHSEDSDEGDCGKPLHEFRVLRVLNVDAPDEALARIVGTCSPAR